MQEGIQFLLGEINFCLCLTYGKVKPPHGGQGTLTIPAQPTVPPAMGRPLALSIAGAATLFQHKLQHHWSCHCQPFQAALPPAPGCCWQPLPWLGPAFHFHAFSLSSITLLSGTISCPRDGSPGMDSPPCPGTFTHPSATCSPPAPTGPLQPQAVPWVSHAQQPAVPCALQQLQEADNCSGLGYFAFTRWQRAGTHPSLQLG